MKKKKPLKIKKISKAPERSMIQLDCTICGQSLEVSGDVSSVICPDCTLIQDLKIYGVPPEVLKAKAKIKNNKDTKKPRGWHFMKVFVDIDGSVYHRGIEHPELKNTLDITIIKDKPKKKKLGKFEKKQLFGETAVKIQEQKKLIDKIKKAGKKVGIKTIERNIKRLKKIQKKYIYIYN